MDGTGGRRNVLCSRANMKRILVSVWCLAVWLPVPASGVAQQPAASRPKVLALFTAGGELDHFLFAQQAMRALGASATDGGYAFAATSDWDALNDSSLRDVRVVIWLNDMPHTLAQRQAFERCRPDLFDPGSANDDRQQLALSAQRGEIVRAGASESNRRGNQCSTDAVS